MILHVSALWSGSKLRVGRVRRGRRAWVRCGKSVKAYNSVRFDPARIVQMGAAGMRAASASRHFLVRAKKT